MSSIIEKIKSLTVPVETQGIGAKKEESERIDDLQKSRVEKQQPLQFLQVVDKLTEAVQVISSATGDTIILQGRFGFIYEITNITAFKSTGSTQAFKFKRESGSAFATERDISSTDASDKESNGGTFVRFNDRIVVEVTGAVASSLIDVTISYDVWIARR